MTVTSVSQLLRHNSIMDNCYVTPRMTKQFVRFGYILQCMMSKKIFVHFKLLIKGCAILYTVITTVPTITSGLHQNHLRGFRKKMTENQNKISRKTAEKFLSGDFSWKTIALSGEIFL